jgi:hypothetical protein
MLHLKLLQEHERFFLLCQHSSANWNISGLPEKYDMSNRMWRYGIYSLLEILRQNLPQSLEHLLYFITEVSSILQKLTLHSPALGDSLFEQLGDVARYGVFVDKLKRKHWEAVSRYWYQPAAERNPDSGQIQHNLAILSQSDPLEALFHLTKALISVQPIPHSRVAIGRLFHDWDNLAL